MRRTCNLPSSASQWVGVYQSVSLSVCQSVSLSVCQSVSQSVRQSVMQSVPPSVNPSVRQSVSQSVNQSFSQSVSQSVNQLVSQSVIQSVSQSVSKSDWSVISLSSKRLRSKLTRSGSKYIHSLWTPNISTYLPVDRGMWCHNKQTWPVRHHVGCWNSSVFLRRLFCLCQENESERNHNIKT